MELMTAGTKTKGVPGRLGVLIPGLGAVASTWIAGVHAVRKGWGLPIGSLTQLGHLEGGSSRRIRDALPLAGLEDLVFGAWDLFDESAYEAALRSEVLDPALVRALEPELSEVRPMRGVHDPRYLPRLSGTHIKDSTRGLLELVDGLRRDIREFLAFNR